MAAGGSLTPGAAPFILTLEMDGEAFAALDQLRRRYYAPERNLVPAHITLFRALPSERGREIKGFLTQIAATQKPIEISPGEVKTMENGVAIFLHSPQLAALRQELAREWGPWLDAPDKAGFRPHVTIQTTLDDAQAHRTRQAIAATFRPQRVKGVGLHLWRFRDGPWESERVFRFR
jgi:2'-5' RNA ligase